MTLKQLGGALVWVALFAGGCGADRPEPPDQPAPPPTLTRRDPEPAGANCAHGGTAIRIGSDRNGNGVLDDNEVEHTDFVCVPATAVLVRQDALPPSLECPAGGVAVRTGIDDNANGSLEDAEIDQTTTVCGSLELWNRDFTANDWDDPIKVAALRGARVVAGSLSMARSVELPTLELVTGDLSGFGGFALPALREVTGSAIVGGSAAAVPSLPVLERIGGTLSISGTGTQLGAPGLREVHGDVVVTPIGATALSLPALATVGGTLRVHANVFASGIGELHLDQLTSIQGSLVVESEALLADLVLPSLTTVGGNIDGGSNRQHLATVDMAMLHDVGGNVVFDFCEALTTASLPALRSVGGNLSSFFVSTLATLRLDALVVVGGGVHIEHAPLLTTLTLPSLAQVGEMSILGSQRSIQLGGTSLASLDLVALDNVSAEISVSGDPPMQAIRLPVLRQAPSLVLGGGAQLERIEVPRITGLRRLNISGPQLHAIDFAALDNVFDLAIVSTALPDLSGLSRLTRADNLFIDDCNQLHDLQGMPILQRVDALSIIANAALVSLDGLSLVSQIRSSVNIQSNTALTSLAGLAHVTLVGAGGIVIRENGNLADVAMTHLQAIDGGLDIAHEAALTTLSGFAALRSLGTELLLVDLPNVPADDIAAFRHQIGR